MKFFHVYNEDCYKGLVKNGLINKDTGFKVQNVFSMPRERQFNEIAKKGGKLHTLIKENKYPFYIDRIAGGILWFEYPYDKELFKEYEDILGDWFLGCQHHESGSNRKQDWALIRKKTGHDGPYDVDKLKELTKSSYAITPYGEVLYGTSQDSIEYYSKQTYAKGYKEYIEEMRDMYKRRMEDTDGHIVPCDSYYVVPRLQHSVGVKTFMPEVGCQIPWMRMQIALIRGMAKAKNKTWGTYYECWKATDETTFTMPVFNYTPINEWYLTQENHPDDFTSNGKNGGSSRLLQNRIYYYSLMAGADYLSEEWGLNCSYTEMDNFTLSEYGIVKKDFINTALTLQGIKAKVPFAIVLPTKYEALEIPDSINYLKEKFNVYRDYYLEYKLTPEEKEYFGHIENLLKYIFDREEDRYGNERHVITNSRFGDVFDIIYQDESYETFKNYKYLIDATKDDEFIKENKYQDLKILSSKDLYKLEEQLQSLIKETMPCYVDDLCWLVSTDENGQNYLTIFNNEGNQRTVENGDVIDERATKTVNVEFKKDVNLELYRKGQEVKVEKIDNKKYKITISGAGFGLFKF